LVLLLDVGNEDNVIFRSLEEYFLKKNKDFSQARSPFI